MARASKLRRALDSSSESRAYVLASGLRWEEIRQYYGQVNDKPELIREAKELADLYFRELTIATQDIKTCNGYGDFVSKLSAESS